MGILLSATFQVRESQHVDRELFRLLLTHICAVMLLEREMW
jgi:hypothetical protein